MSALALFGGNPVRTGPFTPWPIGGDAEASALRDVLASGRWGGIRADSQTAAFEAELADYVAVPHAAAVANGTAGLMIALRALGVGPGDEVIVPAMTYIATATAATLIGALPVFADIDPHTLTMDPNSMRKALSPMTKAVIVVHLGGHPADMDQTNDIASASAIPVIEDCAQSLGATWRGARTGALAAIGVFSFASTKNISCGEGGAVTTSDRVLADRIAALRDHGRPPGVTDHHPSLGWNLRLSEFQAAVLRPQLARLDRQLAAKQRAASHLARSLGTIPGLQPVPETLDPRVTIHGYFSFALDFDASRFGVPIDTFRAALRAEGIPVGLRTIRACPDEPIYADQANSDYSPSRTVSCANARAACARVVLLGQAAGSGLLLDTPEDLDDVTRAVTKIYDNRRELRAEHPDRTAASALPR